MLRAARTGELGITPDGPKGPRRRAQQGLVYLASRTGLPIVPLGYAYRRCWRFNSWDRFMLPKPFTVGHGVSGEPIEIPPGISTDDVAVHLGRVQAAMDSVTDIAETWAATGRFLS